MKRKIIPYKPYLKEYAKKLRKNMTLSEVLLWNNLKNKRMLNYDFDRQTPVDKYIVDFYCKDLLLAIEIDGYSHSYYETIKNDKLKRLKLTNYGIRIIRFTDEMVKKHMDEVLHQIQKTIEEIEKNVDTQKQPTPDPSKEGNLIIPPSKY